MQCPKCHSQPLRASKIEQGLSAMGCNQCHGALVTLLYYRDWLERTPQSDHESDNPPDEQILHEHPHADHDSHSALSCPKCGRLMAKFRISGESDNRIDLCAFCDEAWLDGGEWELLKTLELNRKMPIVFTQQWQNKVRKELTQKARESRLLKLVSQNDLDEAKKIKAWLASHPHREQLRFFIHQD